jgi:hypothetical protein
MLLYVCPHAIYMCLHPAICVLILLYLHERVAVILLVVEPHDGADVLGPEHVGVVLRSQSEATEAECLVFCGGACPQAASVFVLFYYYIN